MDKIPTAEEFLFDWEGKTDESHPNIDVRNAWIQKVNQLKQFANLHRVAALKAASEQATIRACPPRLTNIDGIEVNPESILNAYPPENIT